MPTTRPTIAVSLTDPRSNVFSWAFDSLNRLIRETDEGSAQVNLTRNGKDEVTVYSDPRSLTTSYVRNGFGDVIRRASPDSGTTDYEVNALGKVTKITDARGVVTDLAYDNAGRLTSKQYPAATAENVTHTWTPPPAATRARAASPRSRTSLARPNGSSTRSARATQEKKTTGSAVYTVDYGYDADGNVTQMTYPSGRIVTYARDSLGRITGVTTKKRRRERDRDARRERDAPAVRAACRR